MTYPTYEYVSREKLLAQCKQEIGIENTTTSDVLLRNAMLEALGEIPSFNLTHYIWAKDIPICDHKASVPCGFIRICEPNAIVLRGNNGGCYVPRTINNVMQQGPREFINNWNWCNAVQINNGIIYFSNDIESETFDLYYLGVLKGDDDLPLIPVSHGIVVKTYMKAIWAEARGDNRASMWRFRYGRGKAYLKGKSNVPNNNEKEDIFLIRNSYL